MPRAFTCPHCGHSTRSVEASSETAVCPGCQQPIILSVTIDPNKISTSFRWSRRAWRWYFAIAWAVMLGGTIGCMPVFEDLFWWRSNARVTSQRDYCRSNITQLVKAFQLYEAQHGSLPPAYTVDEEGRPLHSWRTLILPYLERNDLYRRIDFSQPWDSPKNSWLADVDLQVLKCPVAGAPIGCTNYVLLTGPGAVFDGAMTNSFAAIEAADGTANTIILVEVVGTDILWMEPRDLDIADLNAAFQTTGGKSLSSYHSGGVNVVFADGRSQFLSDTVTPATLRALATFNGGETITPQDLFPSEIR